MAGMVEDLSHGSSERELWEPAHSRAHQDDQLRWIPNWLRWILVLPATVFSYVAVIFFMSMMAEEVKGSWIPGVDEILIPLYVAACSCLLAPWVSVMAGAHTAPAYRSQAAMVLAGLWCMLVGVLEFSHLLLTPQRLGPGCMDRTFWFNALTLIGCAIAAGVAAWKVHHDEKATST